MKHKKAFTLIEVMVVMAIIAVLSVLIIGAISVAKKTARESAAKADAETLKIAIEVYQAKYGTMSAVGWHSAYQCTGTGLTCDTGSSGLNNMLVNTGGAEKAQFFRDAATKGSGRFCSPDGKSYKLWVATSSSVFTDTFEWGDKTKCDSHTMPADAFDFSS